MRSLAGLLVFVFVGAGAACSGSGERDPRSALDQQRLVIMQRFAAVQEGVRNTQAQALGDPGLQPLRDRFYDLLRARMLEIDAGADSLLDRAKVVGAQMEEMSRPIVLEQGTEPPAQDRAAVASEFSRVEKALQPLQHQAMTDQEVYAAFTALQDSLHATMVGLNPEVESALIRMEALAAELDEVDAKLRALTDE